MLRLQFREAAALPRRDAGGSTLLALSRASEALLDDPSELAPEALDVLVDALPWLRPQLCPVVLERVDEMVGVLRGIRGAPASDAQVVELLALPCHTLGLFSLRCVLNGLALARCTAGFVDTAEERIAAGSSDQRELRPCPLVPLRWSAAVEYSLDSGLRPEAEGQFLVQSCPQRHEPAPSPWIRAVLLPASTGSGGEAQDPALCVLYQALCQLCDHLAAAHRTDVGQLVQQRAWWGSVRGSVQIFVSEIVHLRSVAALRQFQVLVPGVSLAVSIRGEPRGQR